MALKAKVEKLDDVPQGVRDQYKKVEADGKTTWILDVEAVDGLELTDPSGLLSTVEKLRPLEGKLKRYGTLTPEEAIANVATIADLRAQLEAERLKGNKVGDAERQQLMAERQQVVEQMKRLSEEQVLAEKKRSQARLEEVIRLRRDEAADAALTEAGFKSARRMMKPVLVGELDVIEDETATDPTKRFRTVVRGTGPDGVAERLIVDPETKATRPMTPRDRALEMAKDKELGRYVDATEPPPIKPPNARNPSPPVPTPNKPKGTQPPSAENPVDNLRAAFASSRPTQPQ
jgi:hypothetical protein